MVPSTQNRQGLWCPLVENRDERGSLVMLWREREGAWANPAGLHVQETLAIFGVWQHAGFEATEDAVAVAG
jgi:hypothetical protein